MKQVLSILLFVFSVAFACIAQTPVQIHAYDCDVPFEFREKWAIQRITLGNAILIKEIEQLIREETEKTEMFRKGLGYISIIPSNDLDDKNISSSYYIDVDYTALKKTDSNNRSAYLAYPEYYSFVADRLTFINLISLNQVVCKRFTESSMRKIRRIQNRYLEKTYKATARDKNGKKVFTDRHFRIDYSNWHGGKYVNFYHDGSYKVILDPYGRH